MTKYHMGINMGHDRSVAIVKDGEIIVAIEQERLDRNKHSVGYMLQSPLTSQIQVPIAACSYCLEACGISLEDIESITPNMPGYDLAPDIMRDQFFKYVIDKVARIPSHHLAHAYSAFWPSGFDNAIILVVDATGSTDDHQQSESYTLYEGRGNKISVLHAEKVASHLASLSTLGFIYEYITGKAGFLSKAGPSMHIAEAGKLMGLAPYGSHQKNFHRWIHPHEGSYSLSISPYDIFLEIAAIEKIYASEEAKPYLRPYIVDLAYKVQQELEEALIHLVNLAVKQTGIRKLCIAGGVGLNSVANYQILSRLGLDDIFIFPAAGDNGIAAGCALWAYHTIEKGRKRSKLNKATLGRCYKSSAIKEALNKFESSINVTKLTKQKMITRTAQALSAGHIVAHFEGGSEYGPRALGHRSIIVDPTFNKMKDVLNARVKHRESFRPFAPVIPQEDISKVFELKVASPFMLLVAKIRQDIKEQIPAVTHIDDTGRIQTVSKEENPYFYHLCHKLVELRQGPPVLLNTSFNIAGQPIVETPEEAIQTFLLTDIDYLSIENFWISKKDIPILSYDEKVKKTDSVALPHGLPADIPGVTDLMEKLDNALFFGDFTKCPWNEEELKKLSSEGAFYKETSVLFPKRPFYGPLQTRLSSDIVLLIDPLNKSRIVNLRKHSFFPSSYTFEETKLLLAIANAPKECWGKMRLDMQLTSLEFEHRIQWACQQLAAFGIKPRYEVLTHLQSDSALSKKCNLIFEAFEDDIFSIKKSLIKLNDCLKQAGYEEDKICSLLEINSLQEIKPTHLHYYDKYILPKSALGDLIRLFQLRSSLTETRLIEIFGSDLFSTLTLLGILIKRGKAFASRIDLFCIEGLFLATDHRFMILDEDSLDENPVMYIGLDSIGLVHTAPRYKTDNVLDLCCGSGIQGLIASRYSKNVTAIDYNPRCIRFSRFNAQLNGIENIQFHLGSLYDPVHGKKFNTVLANPPFVPSPKNNYCFRDGGSNGEDILRQIIKESADHLTEDGNLFIVSDLVDIKNYKRKLEDWWTGGSAHKLVLHTADRNDILFSVPHSHAPFGQTFEEYKAELEQWIDNFHKEKIEAVNFGYILICRLDNNENGSYYLRTIHSPKIPIYSYVSDYFHHRHILKDILNSYEKYLIFSPDLYFRIESNNNLVALSSRDLIKMLSISTPVL